MMNRVGVCSFKDTPIGDDVVILNVTTRSKTWHRCFSPMLLGPVLLGKYWKNGNELWSKNMENAWQYSKVYREHLYDDADINNITMDDIKDDWFKWAKDGFNNPYGIRYPMGKGVKPLCSIKLSFDCQPDEILTYLEARRKIYIPLYIKSVEESGKFNQLFDECRDLQNKGKQVYLWDFDVENGLHFNSVVRNPDKKLGHAYILAALLNIDAMMF